MACHTIFLRFRPMKDCVTFPKKATVEPLSGHPRDQKKCPLKRGVRLWEIKNVLFVCSWEYDQVSAYERCPLAEARLYVNVKVGLRDIESLCETDCSTLIGRLSHVTCQNNVCLLSDRRRFEQ